MADDKAAAKKRDWYGDGKAREGAAAGSGQEAEAPSPFMTEMKATMDRHGAEHDDMRKRHSKEMDGLLGKYDEMMAGAAPDAAIGQGGGAQAS
jgi:hypothetical protein